MVVKGAQGVYESHNVGNALMTTVGNPICLITSIPCMQPSILHGIFRLQNKAFCKLLKITDVSQYLGCKVIIDNKDQNQL